MKSILTKLQVLSFLCALPALANDVGLYNSSAHPTRANTVDTATSEGLTIVIGYNKEFYEAHAEDLLGHACQGLQDKYEVDGRWNEKSAEVGCNYAKGTKLTILTQPHYSTVYSVHSRKADEVGYSVLPSKLPQGAISPNDLHKLKDSFKVMIEAADGKKAIVTIPLRYDLELLNSISFENKLAIDSSPHRYKVGLNEMKPNA